MADSVGNAGAIVRASIDAYNRHDIAACMALLAPDGVWELMGVGQTMTAEEVRIVLWQYFLRAARLDIRTLVTAGASVAAEYTQSFLDDDRQRRVSAPVAAFYEVAHERIARIRLYYHPDWDATEEAPAATPAD